MVLVGHAQRISKPLTRLQRWLVGGVLVVIAGVSAWAITQAASAPTSSNGCINLVVPGSMGGGIVSHCGAAARSWCASEYRQSDRVAALAVAQCRRAGIGPKAGRSR
jgi:hypothetical protein